MDDVVKEPAAYQAITSKQVKDTFAKYYDPKNAIVVVVKPQNSTSTDSDKPAVEPGM